MVMGISSSPNTFVKSNGVLTSTSSGINNNTAPSSCSLDTVRTQFFAWSCRWFTRPLLSTYGQLNDDTKLKNHELSKSSGMDHELVSLGTISVDPDAVAYTDRVNRLRKQRKLSHLGRIQWELVAGEISCANTPMTNARSVSSDHGAHNNMTRSRISLRSSDSGGSTTTNSLSSGYLHPIAYYNYNVSSNTTVSNTVSSIPTHVKFHPYQPHLVVVDSKKGVAIHSSKNLDHLHSIHTPVSSNSLFPELSLSSSSCVDGYPRVACVTDVEFINAAEEQSLLLTASDDGYIRVWRNYTHNLGQDPEILTAWIGITDLYQTDYPIGVVVHWNQQANQLSVSGDTRTIRIWDCNCESRLRDLNTGADTSVTCLTQSEDNNLLAAGFNDGGIRVWDLRLPSVHNNDNLVFNSQADSDRIYKVIFSPLNRLYAVGAMGGIGAWQLSSPTGSGSTCNTSTSGTCINNGRNSFSHHPRRCISTAVRSSLSSTNGIHNDNASSSSSSSTTRRFRRLPCPPRLSLPMNSSVNCADLLVNLSSPHAHLTLAGIRGQSSISLHRIQDGSLHSSIKHYGHLSREQFGTPTCCAFHPNESPSCSFVRM
ncbi:unnamed protein product [Heterobilharzia americana]|nr:unnamed protein product [Heterobilharzia americana]